MAARPIAWGVAATFALLDLALAAAALYLWSGGSPALDARDAKVGRGIDDPEVRRAAVLELVSRTHSHWDNVADPEVARLLQPNLDDVKLERMRVSSNRFGMRERSYALPKEEGTLRIVLLGDSFVMGQGVAQSERLGCFLEAALRERGRGPWRAIECLHLGIDGWNTIAETTFLRRQLSLLEPDLVVQLLICNDTEDNVGARGFGAMASFDPAHGELGDGVFQARHPQQALGTSIGNLLQQGFDWESRRRFEVVGAAVARLAREVERLGGRYLLLDDYSTALSQSRLHITRLLRPEQVCFLPSSLAKEQDHLAADGFHWNRAGHELVARMLYAVLERRRLVPGLELDPWPEASALLVDYEQKGREEAEAEFHPDRLPVRRRVGSVIDFTALDDASAAQVDGGIARGGIVSPYAVAMLRCEGRGRLHVVGASLPRPELDGARVEVFVDEVAVGALELQSGRALDSLFDLPADVSRRPFVSVRFVSSDWVYGLPDLRQHQVFALHRVELTESPARR